MAIPIYIPTNSVVSFVPILDILFSILAIIVGVPQYLIVMSICISLMITEVEHLYMFIGHLDILFCEVTLNLTNFSVGLSLFLTDLWESINSEWQQNRHISIVEMNAFVGCY